MNTCRNTTKVSSNCNGKDDVILPESELRFFRINYVLNGCGSFFVFTAVKLLILKIIVPIL